MNSETAITRLGLDQFFDGLRSMPRPVQATQPVVAGGGIRIRALCDLIARTLPSLAHSDGAMMPSKIDSEPLTSTWYTQSSGQYARLVMTSTQGGEIGQAGAATSTWQGQSLPAYTDIHLVSRSADHLYVSSNGLPSHIIGPWRGNSHSDSPHTSRRTFQIPRIPWLAETGVVTAAGDVGVWVNGIPIDNLIGYGHHDLEAGRDVDGGDSVEPFRKLWLRHKPDACVDPSNGWIGRAGDYRYHANPLALRCQLRDNTVYLPRADCYREDVSNLRHSPILGWTFEGLPIYGPYGYADPLVASSGVRRMVSGFVLRDGENGTVDLRRTGRRSMPRWAAAMHGLGERLAPQQVGPDVTSGFELGRYVEDYEFLGDVGGVQGRDFDLDQCNGRYCVTPEFPDGTFAYFVTLAYDGSPAFPYVVGPRSYGVRDGGVCRTVPGEAEAVVEAGMRSPVRLDYRNIGTQQMLTWTSIEGGHYRIDASHDGSTWITVDVNVRSEGLTTEYTEYTPAGERPYRQFLVTLTSTEPCDG